MADLPIYLWKGINTKGNHEKGEIHAQNPAVAQSELKKQGITAYKVTIKSKSFFNFNLQRKKKVKSLDILIFTRQLATMLTAGLPIVKAFDIIGKKHENKNMEELISTLNSHISAGSTLSETLSKYPEYFDNLYCSLVDAGERSGTLEVMLVRVALYQEKSQTLKKKIKKASMYPLVVFSATFIAAGILLIFVVPTFEGMFKSFGANLPAFTQIVVNLSTFLKSNWLIILALLASGIFGFVYSRKHSPKFSFWVDKMILRLPVAGIITKKAIVARFTRTLATTLSAGMPIVTALGCVNNVIENKVYKNAITSVKDSVASGQSVSAAIEKTEIFPSLVSKMIAVGEEAGSLEDMLNKIASYFEEDVDSMVDNLSALLEPLIMIVLGVIIGGFVIAMYLPIFRMGSIM